MRLKNSLSYRVLIGNSEEQYELSAGDKFDTALGVAHALADNVYCKKGQPRPTVLLVQEVITHGMVDTVTNLRAVCAWPEKE